jgi:predicted 2-oxoglutarate/Fe(II)-dependent dioxygenase YbiX
MSPFTSTPQVTVTRERIEGTYNYITSMIRTDGSRSVVIEEMDRGARLMHNSTKFGPMTNLKVTMSGVYQDARVWVEAN